MESSSSTALPNQVVETYRRQEKRARIAGINIPPRAHCGSPAADPNWRDWANLIAGPAGLIAERVLAIDVADYLRFRAVCRSWHRCTASPHAHGGLDRRFHPRRWIMLPRTLGVLRKRRDFMNVSTGERIQVDLPELRCQYVLGTTSDGLIVLCDKRTDAVNLLNPLTGQLTGLPSVTTLLDMPSSQWRIRRSRLKYLQVLGAGLADETTVAFHLGPTALVIAKPGDEGWTPWRFDHRNAIVATLSFAGRFYCVTENAIMVVDTNTDQRPPQLSLVAELSDWDFKWHDKTVKLVDNDGELLLVHGIRPGKDHYHPLQEGYEVHRVDLDAGKTVPMQGLGGRALFAGHGPVLSVPAGLSPHVHAETVYSCRDHGELDDRPMIIEPYNVLYGYYQRNIDDVQACSVVDYISRYVCLSKIIVRPRLRSHRQALQPHVRLSSINPSAKR
ncbi:unnamed protein product [Alopecurus aequalis]